jgi:LEA14-like dessication related protein
MMMIRFQKPSAGRLALGGLFCLLIPVFSLLFSACRSGPAAGSRLPRPEVYFELDHIEAEGPEDLSVHFSCRMVNPRRAEASFRLRKARAFINGAELIEGSALELEEGSVAGESEASFKGVLKLDLRKAPLKPGEDTINAGILLDLDFTFADKNQIAVSAEWELSFPRIQPPVFTIQSIQIMQAELINTRLKVRIKVDNPNPFPVQLSAFNYELYGAGRFWADGSQKNVYSIPGRESAEANLYLMMNFTNMRRDVLDRVIELRQVNYRFSGKAEIGTGVEYLPVFTSRFDLKGESEVIQ